MKKKGFNKKALTPEQSFREGKKAKNKKQNKGYHLIKKYSNKLALYRVRTLIIFSEGRTLFTKLIQDDDCLKL